MSDVKIGDRVRVDRPSVEGVVDYVSKYDDLMDIRLDDKSIYATQRVDVVTKLASPLKVGDKLSGDDNPEPPIGTLLHFDNQNEIAHRRSDGWYHAASGPYQWRAIDHSNRTVIHVPES